jgi:hypothetical protein
MDTNKDNHGGGNTGEDTKVSVEIPAKNLEPIAFFKDDGNFIFAYKKTEKLVAAVYLITNLLSDNEPIKWTLRKKAGELLSFMLGLKDIFFSRKVDFVYTAKHNVIELVSLLQVSYHGGLISEMNYSILKQEFSALISAVESSGHSPSNFSRDVLPKEFFREEKDGQKTAISHPKEQAKEYTLPQRGTSHKLENLSSSTPRVKSLGKDGHFIKRSHRQDTILSLLKKKGDLTIKDISEVIKDCSEKTIQRELSSFISGGLVRRTGERRWSRYSLSS